MYKGYAQSALDTRHSKPVGHPERMRLSPSAAERNAVARDEGEKCLESQRRASRRRPA